MLNMDRPSPQPPLDVKPMGRYHTSEQDCPAAHFNQQQMIFDITLCGQWAGREFLNAGCGHATPGQTPYDACDAYVGANPGAFSESRWEINSLRAYGSYPARTQAPSPLGPRLDFKWGKVALVTNQSNPSLRLCVSSSSVEIYQSLGLFLVDRHHMEAPCLHGKIAERSPVFLDIICRHSWARGWVWLLVASLL